MNYPPISTRQQMVSRTYEIYRSRDLYFNEGAMHHHDFYEMNLFLSGDVEYTIESRIYHATPGDILLISPNELHQPMFGVKTPAFERVVLWVDRAYLDQMGTLGAQLNRCFERSAERGVNLLRPDGGIFQLMRTLLENVILELEAEQFGWEMAADTCLLQFLVLLNRLEERSTQTPELRDRSGSVVGKVLAYINEHYYEDLSLDLLANKFFISKYHLSREFNRLVGTSVYRYITQKRLVMAKQMLSEGVPSSEAYQHCGFGDYSSFYRAFRSEYQISPKEFVSKLKEDAARNAKRSQNRRAMAGYVTQEN